MTRKIMIPASLAAIALVAIGFQNCAKKSNVTDAASIGQIGEMSAAQVQSMMSGYETGCATYVATSSSFPTVPTNGSVTLPSASLGKGTQVASVSGTGSYTFVGTAAGAKIASVSQVKGAVVACSASIGAITDSQVNVLVDGGALTEISNSTGAVMIFGSDYPSKISGFTGNVLVKVNGVYKGRSYALTGN